MTLKESTQQEEKQTTKIPPMQIRYCRHATNAYSLTIQTDERHVDTMHSSAGYFQITIYDLTPAEMMSLSRAILDHAVRIQMEDK